MPPSPCQLSAIPSLASIAVIGPDAEGYLAAQLSQVPPARGSLRAPFAAWHDAKGRVQALFRVLRQHDGFVLLTHSSVAAELTVALRRYVLRAQVRVEITAADNAAVAIVGDSSEWLRTQRIELGAEPGASAAHDDVPWVRLGPQLVQIVASSPQLEWLQTALPNGRPTQAELAEIRLGLPVVAASLRGLLLPQMLNLDLLGGVAFDKGCYPGQEIIARTQNLGSIKRRMLRFIAHEELNPPAAGSKLLDASGAHAGTVVRAAAAERGTELLAVIPLEAQQGELVCEQAPTTPLRVAPLPYAIPGVAAG